MDARPFPDPPPEEGARSSRPSPAPPTPATHAAAAALPRRHLGCCHVSWSPRGSPGPPAGAGGTEDFAPRPNSAAASRPRGAGASASPHQRPRVPGARKTASPSATPPDRAPASDKNPSPTRGDTAQSVGPRYLRHGLSRWGVPLQSLVLLPPLQRPMLPQALLPLIRHGGRGPCGSGGRKAPTRRKGLHLQRRGKEMAAVRRARVLYRLCLCGTHHREYSSA